MGLLREAERKSSNDQFRSSLRNRRGREERRTMWLTPNRGFPVAAARAPAALHDLSKQACILKGKNRVESGLVATMREKATNPGPCVNLNDGKARAHVRR